MGTLSDQTRNRVLLFGATGTIGRATVRALVDKGHHVTCVIRRDHSAANLPAEPRYIVADVTDKPALGKAFSHSTSIDVVISCLASRTGKPKDAWAIDYQAHMNILETAQQFCVPHMVLLSAICVQKPKLAFQYAKLKFEAALQTSGLTYTIIRPTAYFKSLSGQFARVQAGKAYLTFGDGTLTACKPISDRDLAEFLVNSLNDPALQNQILPIGGPGPALTPHEMGTMLYDAVGLPPTFKSVPPRLFLMAARLLDGLGIAFPSLREKAEYARTAHYYATESMLVWDAAQGVYNADATPEYGCDTLSDHYRAVARGDAKADLGDHALFGAEP